MPQDKDPRPRGPFEEAREMASNGQALLVLLALPVLLFLRKPGTAGPHFFGGRLAVGLLLAALVVTFAGGIPDGLASFLGVWALIFAAMHNLGGAQRRRKGYRCHSFYGGDSWFQGLQGERKAKGRTEPEVILLFALLAFAVSQGLGVYLLAASFAVAATHSMSRRQVEARAQAAYDAQFEAQQLADHMRGY